MIRVAALWLAAALLALPALAETPEARPEHNLAIPAASADAAEPAIPQRSARDWYDMGGAVMHGIAFCLALVLAVTAERMVALRRSITVPHALCRSLLGSGLRGETLETCRLGSSSIGRVAAIFDREQRAGGSVIEAVAQAGALESAEMSRHVPLLAALGNIATMLGLLGTVFGMIEAFQQIAVIGTGDARVVAGGIFRALVTTAAGLSVGIIALSAHAYLRRRIDALRLDLEGTMSALLDDAPGTRVMDEDPQAALPAGA